MELSSFIRLESNLKRNNHGKSVLDNLLIFLIIFNNYYVLLCIYLDTVICESIDEHLKQSKNDGQYAKYIRDCKQNNCPTCNLFPPTFDDYKSLQVTVPPLVVATTTSNDVVEPSVEGSGWVTILEDGLSK